MYTEEQLNKLCDALARALVLAVEHLDWTGWGDTWERECIRDSGNKADIERAAELAVKFLNGTPIA